MADIDNPSDQLMSIAEALDTTRKDKGYSNNEDMMHDILLDIYDDYYRYQADEQAKAAEGPETEPGDDGPGNNEPQMMGMHTVTMTVILHSQE